MLFHPPSGRESFVRRVNGELDIRCIAARRDMQHFPGRRIRWRKRFPIDRIHELTVDVQLCIEPPRMWIACVSRRPLGRFVVTLAMGRRRNSGTVTVACCCSSGNGGKRSKTNGMAL